MAEVAGLVIGGISLNALFDQCITIVKYFDAAASCSDDFQDAALMLTLLGRRLDGWERSLIEQQDFQSTEEDGQSAELWLRQIHKRLESAEKLGSRYLVEQPAAAAVVASGRSKEVSRVLKPLRKAFKQDGGLTFAKRARWALFDQEKMVALVDKLEQLVSSLESLFPALHDRRVRIAKDDAVAFFGADEASQQTLALEALRLAAAKVDKNFDTASSLTSHTYRNIDVTDKAIVTVGDHYSDGWVKAGGALGGGGSNSYEGIRIGGNSNANIGNVYGGKSAMEIGRS